MADNVVAFLNIATKLIDNSDEMAKELQKGIKKVSDKAGDIEIGIDDKEVQEKLKSISNMLNGKGLKNVNLNDTIFKMVSALSSADANANTLLNTFNDVEKRLQSIQKLTNQNKFAKGMAVFNTSQQEKVINAWTEYQDTLEEFNKKERTSKNSKYLSTVNAKTPALGTIRNNILDDAKLAAKYYDEIDKTASSIKDKLNSGGSRASQKSIEDYQDLNALYKVIEEQSNSLKIEKGDTESAAKKVRLEKQRLEIATKINEIENKFNVKNPTVSNSYLSQLQNQLESTKEVLKQSYLDKFEQEFVKTYDGILEKTKSKVADIASGFKTAGIDIDTTDIEKAIKMINEYKISMEEAKNKAQEVWGKGLQPFSKNQQGNIDFAKYIQSYISQGGKLEDFTKEMQDRFNSLTQSQPKIQSLVNSIKELYNTDFNTAGTGFGGIGLDSEELQNLLNRIETLETNVGELQNKVNNLDDTGFDKLNGSAKEFSENVSSILEKLDTLVGKLGKSEGSVTPGGSLTEWEQKFASISNQFNESLTGAITNFKEELQSTSNISYTKMFDSLRNTLRDIVNEFQTSLTNIRFDKSNALYDTLRGWNDGSRYMTNYNDNSDAERAALANLNKGTISNGYTFDKDNSFSKQLLAILNQASQGVEQDISQVYDTWIHSHPIEKSKKLETSKGVFENVATTGSDIGFSVADLNIWAKEYLESGLKNMLVTNNYEYTKLDLTDVSKEKFEEFKKVFIKELEASGVVVNATTGDTTVPLQIKGTKDQKYIDLDQKTETINSAMQRALDSTGLGSERLSTGNITDLVNNVSKLSQEEQEAKGNAQGLLNVVEQLNGMLNGVDNKGLQLGISEESLNGIIYKLDEIISAIKEIASLKVDNPLKETQKELSNISSENQINIEQQLNDEIEKRESILRELYDIQNKLTVGEDFHGNDRYFADALPTEDEIRKADTRIKELTGLNNIFDVNKLIEDRNRWLNEVKYSLEEYDDLIKSNNQKAIDDYTSQGLSRIDGAESFFGFEDNYNSIASKFAEKRQKIESEIGKLYENIEKFSELQTKDVSSNIGTTGMESETSQAESLRSKITEVTTAVDAKTNAFREEEQVVDGTIQSEINNLQALSSWVQEVRSELEKLSTIKLDFGIDETSLTSLEKIKTTVSENLSDSNINTLIPADFDKKLNDLVESLSVFDLYIQDLKKDTNGLDISKKILPSKDFDQKLSSMAESLEVFKLSLDRLGDGGEFIKSINNLTSKGEELKNLANILKSSAKQIEATQKVTESSSGEVESSFNNSKSKVKELSEIENAYQTLINTEKEYQKLSAKRDVTGKSSAKLEELNLKREQANTIISSATKLTEEEIKAQEKYNKTIKEGQVIKQSIYNNAYSSMSSESDAYVEAERINTALNKTQQIMNGLSNSNIVGFEEIFKEAQFEVDKLNDKLVNGMDVSTYQKKISNIKTDLDKIVATVPTGNTEDIQKAMRSYISEVSNGKAVIQSWDNDNTKLIATYIDEEGQLRKLTIEYNAVSNAIQKTGDQSKKTESGLTKMFNLFKDGWKNVARYVSTFMGFYEIIALIRQGISVVKDLDTALTEMRKVSDETVSSLKDFQKVSFDIADSVGTTAKQIQNSTADWMRLGESLNEATESAKTSNILLNVSEFDSIDEATESLVAMSSAYSELDKMNIVDKLNEVGNNYAISTDGLATALQKSASALKTAGNDMDEAVALVTAGNAVVQDPDSVGAGVRTISLRLTGTKEAEQTLTDLGEDTEGVITTVSKLRETIMSATAVASNGFKGFDILDENGNYKSTYEILKGISNVYQEIVETDEKTGSNNKNLLLETIAGEQNCLKYMETYFYRTHLIARIA